MARRWTKWLVLVAAAGSTMALVLASRFLTTGKPSRVPSLAIHRPGTPNVGSALLDAAEEALSACRYTEAEDLARMALVNRENALGLDHPALIQPLRILVGSLAYRGQFVEAEPLARRGLAFAERNPASPLWFRIVMLGRVGWVCAGLGHGEEADELTRLAVNLAEAAPGSDQQILIEALGVRGATLGEVGQDREAIAPLERALAILEANPTTTKVTSLRCSITRRIHIQGQPGSLWPSRCYAERGRSGNANRGLHRATWPLALKIWLVALPNSIEQGGFCRVQRSW